ncbi:hypothetical protein FNV43_RR03222 [Rhamnella rubrinervis]|uniref:Protein kinase domain-containing protein n=1 Tax=Rhamnella rubrinervis TaxID=2594499 RepID=A0A8K0HJF8_9ROSA|nr:hypothetical protein FNV43_RR03222 [Rhamnella rubrinervis]
MFYWGSLYDTYSGIVHDGHQVPVKKLKYYGISEHEGDSLDMIMNEVAIASQKSKHKNVLKLLQAVVLSLICPRETHVEAPGLSGTVGLVTPELCGRRYRYTEKTDVYYFGNLLSVILTEQDLSEEAMEALWRIMEEKKNCKMTIELKNKNKKEKDYLFMRNGAEVLEQVITSFNGNCNPIRTYSIKDLNKATNNFHVEGLLCWSSRYRLYKGVHEHHQISVKKFDGSGRRLKLIANEVAIASQMNDYKHPWLTQLRIATQVAHAVAYLHYGFSKMIIHRDLTIEHIFLDQDYVAKLSEFQTSLLIPEGETHVDAEVYGTCELLAPELALYGRHTEKTDVYSFGVVLCKIFVGKTNLGLLNRESNVSNSRSSSSNSEDESRLVGSFGEKLAKLCKTYLEANIFVGRNRVRVLEFVKLIENCLKTNPDERPNMIQVTKALRSIQRM